MRLLAFAMIALAVIMGLHPNTEADVGAAIVIGIVGLLIWIAS
jgi:lipopolysaccharide export LptBFGC system permease protein LptF